MTSRAQGRRRAGKLSISGGVVPPGTLPGRAMDHLAIEERSRLALVALGELILKLQQAQAQAEAGEPRPTMDV